MLKPCRARAGSGWNGKKGREMNIILYYIILYIILYIYIVDNILQFRAKPRVVFADRFFFFDAEC